jgi:hypothetical protein
VKNWEPLATSHLAVFLQGASPFLPFALFLFFHNSSSQRQVVIAIMSWRNQGITGSNNIPLGTRRRFGGDDGGAQDGGYVPSPSSDGMTDSSYKRGRSPARGIGSLVKTNMQSSY